MTGPAARAGEDPLRDAWRAGAPRLRRRLVRIVGEAEADDLLQDVFERALLRRPDGLAAEALAAWLLRVARHAAIDRLRARAVRLRTAGEPLAPAPRGEPAPDVALQRKQACACIAGLVERLPAGQRAVLELAELHGLTDRETAGKMGITVGSAKIRLHRARRSLRAVMEAECRTFRDERNELSCEPIQPGARDA